MSVRPLCFHIQMDLTLHDRVYVILFEYLLMFGVSGSVFNVARLTQLRHTRGVTVIPECARTSITRSLLLFLLLHKPNTSMELLLPNLLKAFKRILRHTNRYLIISLDQPRP
jgi:hypothetical protein